MQLPWTHFLALPPSDEWRYQGARGKVLIQLKHTAGRQAVIIAFRTFREIYSGAGFDRICVYLIWCPLLAAGFYS